VSADGNDRAEGNDRADGNDRREAVSEVTVSAVDAPGETAESSTTTESASTQGNSRSSLPTVAVVLTAVVAVLAVVVGWLAYGRIHDSAVERARVEARAAAEAEVVAMLEYDFATVDEQAEAAVAGLTPDFATEYMNLMTNVVAPGAKEKSITVQVSVQGSSVVSADADNAVMLLYLNQITTSSDRPEAASSGSRVRVEMQKDGDRWLVDRLTPV